VAQAVYSLAVGSSDAAAYDTVQQMYEQVRLCKVIRNPGVLWCCMCGSFVLDGGLWNQVI
jgi:hypothetical protein